MRIETAELPELRDEWTELALARGGIFSTWEWAKTWWAHFGAARQLALRACRTADGELAAVLPLYLARVGGARVVRFVGHGPADELGPVHLPGWQAATAECVHSALAGLRWDVFLGEQLPAEADWGRLLAAERWRREASPVIRLPTDGWEAFVRERSASFREQLRRRSRALSAAGEVRFRLADETSLERDLDTLFLLHRARWGTRRTAFRDAAFHRDVARAAAERGWLRLWTLELDGRPTAAWHGFRVGSVVDYYQAGRDPAFERLSVGFLLLAHTVRAAIEEGAAEYRLGRGAEPFKYRFTDHDPGLESVALAVGLRGHAAWAAARLARRVLHAGRGILRRDAR